MTRTYSRDTQILMRILQNQNNIKEAIQHFQCNNTNLHENKMAFDLCALYMAQIGEDIKLLTDSTKQSFSYLNTKELVYFRNMINHTYEKVDKVVLKAYIFNMIDKKTVAEVKERIQYCSNAAKDH